MPTSKAASRDVLDIPELTAAVRDLARRGELRQYRKGTLLIHEGDVGDTLYVILAGRLRVFGSDARSGREITYGTYGAGEYVGEMGLDGEPRAASVMAVEPCTCAVVRRPTLEAFLAEQPAFAFDLLAKVIRRARAATLSTKQLALNDVYGRLKLVLERDAAAAPDGRWRTPERLTHQQLANLVGSSREMVSRLLKDLEQGGYVRVEDDHRLSWQHLPQRW
jgi:CRP/FNR family cyclic AMP-dependent transcriptional regulator